MQGMVNRYQADPVALAESSFHCHDELEFNLVIRGRGSYLLAGRRYDLSRGCLLWLFPRQEHMLISHTADFVMWVVVFTPELVRSQAELLKSPELRSDDPAGYHCRLLDGRAREDVDRLCQTLVDDEVPERARSFGLAWLLTLAWLSYQQAGCVTSQPSVDPMIARAAQLLQDPHQQWQLPALGRELQRSPAWISRRFHAELGLTMSEYRNRQRLSRFFDRHRTRNGANLLELALDSGFTSYPQFTRVFRVLMGMGPRRYFASVS